MQKEKEPWGLAAVGGNPWLLINVCLEWHNDKAEPLGWGLPQQRGTSKHSGCKLQQLGNRMEILDGYRRAKTELATCSIVTDIMAIIIIITGNTYWVFLCSRQCSKYLKYIISFNLFSVNIFPLLPRVNVYIYYSSLIQYKVLSPLL